MSEPSFQGSSQQDPSENEYKVAIQYLQAQYERAEKKLAERQRQLEIALGKGRSAESIKSFEHLKDNFELENQPFEFKSQMNELKYKHLSEKDEMMVHHQKEVGLLVEEYQYKYQSEVERHKQEVEDLLGEIETRNSLIRELEMKPAQIMRELVELGSRSDEQEEENMALRDVIKGMTRELQVLKGEGRVMEDNESEMNRLKAEIVNIKMESEKLMGLNRDKLFYANEEVERYKKLLETYKVLNSDKEAEIRKLSEELMNVELQKTKKTESNTLDQERTLQKLQLRIKQLTEELGAKELGSKQALFKAQEEIASLTQQMRDKETDAGAKGRELQRSKEASESKESELKRYRVREQELLEEIRERKNQLLVKQQEITQVRSQLRRQAEMHLSESRTSELNNQLVRVQLELTEAQERIRLLSLQRKPQSVQSPNQQKLRHNYQKLQRQYNQLSQKLSRHNDLLLQLQQKQTHLKSLTKQNKLLGESKKKLQDSQSEFQKAVRELKYQNQHLKQILEAGSVSGSSTYKDQNQNLSRQNTTLKEEITRQKNKAKGKEQQLQGVRSELSKAIHEKEMMEIRVSELEREKEEVERKLGAEKEYFKNEIIKHTTMIDGLRKSIHEANNQNLVLGSSLEESNSNGIIVKNELELQKSRLREMETLKRKHQGAEDNLKVVNDRLAKEIHQMQMDYEEKEEALRSSQRTQELEKEKAMAKVKKLESQLQSKKALEEELSMANEKIAEFQRNSYTEMERNPLRSLDIRKKTSHSVGMSPEIAKYKVEVEELMRENEEVYTKLDSTEKILETIRKELLGYRKQLNVLSSSEEERKEKIEDQQAEINQAKILIESLRREKTHLTNERRRETLSFQDRIAQMSHENEEATKEKQRLEGELSKLRASISSAAKDYKKTQHSTQQQLQILRVQKEDLEDRLHQVSKGKSLQELKTKKLTQQISTLRSQESELRVEFQRVSGECQSQRMKNTKEIRAFQQLIEKMNQQLLVEKKEYQIKNTMIFKNETSLYNQVNNANQEIERLNQEKQGLIEKINKLIESNSNIEATLVRNTKDNVRLREEMRVEEARRDEFKRGDEERIKDSRMRGIKQSKEEQMVSELENKLKEVQEMKHLKRETDIPTKQKPVQVLQIKIEYSQLLNQYNKLQERHQELELQHTQLTIEYEKYKRRTTKEIYESRINDSEELRNLQQQVEILNSLLTEKDKEIEALKRISSKGYTKYEPPSYQYYTKPYEYPTYGLDSGRELGSKTEIKDYQRMYTHQIPSQEIIISQREIYAPTKHV